MNVRLIDGDSLVRYEMLPVRWWEDKKNMKHYMEFVHSELQNAQTDMLNMLSDQKRDEWVIILHANAETVAPCVQVEIPLCNLLMNRRRRIKSHPRQCIPKLHSARAKHIFNYNSVDHTSYPCFSEAIACVLQEMVANSVRVGFIVAQSGSGKTHFVQNWKERPLFEYSLSDGDIVIDVNPQVEDSFDPN